MQTKLTILCENSVGAPFGVIGEHRLACFVETQQGNYLFDTGQGFAITRNAQALGKDLASIQVIKFDENTSYPYFQINLNTAYWE